MGFHLGSAFRAFFQALSHGEAPAAPSERAALPPPPEKAFHVSPEPAIQLLAEFQKAGRLIDFLQEDISGYDDAQIGAAVRAVHQGCRAVLKERLTLEPVLTVAEGASVQITSDQIASSSVVVSGAVHGNPPYRGRVEHRGWRVTDLNLPTVPPEADARIGAPAQVEVS